MKTWTESSKDRLESYLRNRVLREKLDPEEAAEIVEDWRLHVYEEVERQPESVDRKSTRLNSSHVVISYAVFCLKKKKQ